MAEVPPAIGWLWVVLPNPTPSSCPLRPLLFRGARYFLHRFACSPEIFYFTAVIFSPFPFLALSSLPFFCFIITFLGLFHVRYWRLMGSLLLYYPCKKKNIHHGLVFFLIFLMISWWLESGFNLFDLGNCNRNETKAWCVCIYNLYFIIFNCEQD